MTRPRECIVIVEDDHDVREAVIEVLRSQDYEVVGCENGARALEYLSTCTAPPDLILLDLMMPVMDGWQFRVQQRKNPVLAATPVIVLTADPSPQAKAIDADAVLHKPFKARALLELVASTLETARRDRLARVERMISLGRLVAGIAHEINNPLTYVISNLEFLEHELHSGSYASELQAFEGPIAEALEGAQRIRAAIEQVHRFGAGDRKRKGVRPEQAMEAAIKLIENQIRQRARLVRDYRPAPPVLAGESDLIQILLNLLMNAVQAIPEGEVERHEIGVSIRPDGPDMVRIEVRDTGAGIAEDVQRHMFEPLYAADHGAHGSGLGLSIGYATVRAWGGDLSVHSPAESGTTIRIVLPVATDQELAPPQGEPASAARRGRVLVVDDEPAILRSVRRVLAEHDVVTSSSADAALAILQRDETFDLVLCDLMMPGVTGADLHAAVRSVRPGLEDRFVFMTGGVITPSVERFVKETSCGFVAKPFDAKVLRTLVAERLRSAPSSSPLIGRSE